MSDCTFKVKFSTESPMDVKFQTLQVAGSRKGTIRYDVSQELSEQEQETARDNIGLSPLPCTEDMIQPVGRDAQGRLFTAPTGGGGGGTVDVDPTLTQEGMAADAKAVGDAIGGKITAPASGSVGDVLTVSAVDGEGKPIAVKTQKGVLTDDQKLSEQEKAQARDNIGAAATAGQPLAIKLISDTDDNGNITYSVDKTAAELENAVKNRTLCYLYSGDRIYQFQYADTDHHGDINIGFSSTAEQSYLQDMEFVNIFVYESGTKVSVSVFVEPLLLGATFRCSENLDGDLLGGTTNNAYAVAVCLRLSIDYIRWEITTTGSIAAKIETLDEEGKYVATKFLTDGKLATDGENFVVTFDDLKDGVRYTFTGNINDEEDEEGLIFSTVTKEDIGVADDTKVEHIANKVTELSAESTDTQYPSAKAVYTKFSEIDAVLGSYITDVAELIGGDA